MDFGDQDQEDVQAVARQAIAALLYLEVNGVFAEVIAAMVALFSSNPRPEDPVTFVADVMMEGRPVNNIYPEIVLLLENTQEFIGYLETTELENAFDRAFQACITADPKPADPVAFFAQNLRVDPAPPAQE